MYSVYSMANGAIFLQEAKTPDDFRDNVQLAISEATEDMFIGAEFSEKKLTQLILRDVKAEIKATIKEILTDD